MSWGSGRRRGEGRELDLDLDGWRWRSYCDHLEDLGYDLWGGTQPEGEPARTEGRSPVLATTRPGETGTD